MIFPKWVRKARKTDQAKARLQYIVHKIAVEQSSRPSIRALCEETGVGDHSTITIYINRGSFSPAMAMAFQQKFGRDVVHAEWLTSPLDIKVETGISAK